MTAALDLNLLAQMTAEGMVDCLIEGLVLTVFAGLLSRVIRQTAPTRFAVWFSVLIVIAALPIWNLASQASLSSPIAPTGSASAAITLPGSWALYLSGIWALVVVFALVRFGVGLRQLHVLRKNCRTIPVEDLPRLLQETLRQFRPHRRVTICVSDRVEAPAAIGFIKPAVVFPHWLLEELSPAELQQVLVHELTHLKRWDDWTNLAQKLVKALLFFHPAVWWIERQLALEREMACDDAVLAKTINPQAYAQCLVHIAEKSFLRRSLALAQAAVGRVRQTAVRVARILEVDRPQPMPGWKPAAAWTVVFALLSFGSLRHTPKLVAFQSDELPVIAASASPAPPVLLGAASEYAPHATLVKAVDRPAQKMPLAAPSPRVIQASATPPRITPQRSAVAAAASRTTHVPNLLPVKNPAAPTAAFTASETFLVFVENYQSSPSGVESWQVRVWYIRVVQPEGRPLDSEIPRKSI